MARSAYDGVVLGLIDSVQKQMYYLSAKIHSKRQRKDDDQKWIRPEGPGTYVRYILERNPKTNMPFGATQCIAI